MSEDIVITLKDTLSKGELKTMKEYLSNIVPGKAEAVYGIGEYKPWHGDGKSSTKPVLTTQSIQKTDDKKFRTIIVEKGHSSAGFWLSYESSSPPVADTVYDHIRSYLGIA